MKVHIGIVASILILALTSTQGAEIIDALDTDPISPVESRNSMEFGYGINYLSAYNHYDPGYTSYAVLERDFATFKKQGFKYITLSVIWNYFEPDLGVYNDEAFNNTRIVCEFAANHSLQVNIDFHTLMFHNSTKIPDWVFPRRFETVFTNSTVHQAWLNFLNHSASRLNNVENIYSWHMMNEPANGTWACAVPTDAFIDLWTEMRVIFKNYSDRPVSIRFAATILDDPIHFDRDSRIYDLCDYLALNWYEDQRCPPENLIALINDIHQHGKRVMISEFGFNKTDDDDIQAGKFEEYLELFKNAGVEDTMAWMWRADNSSTSNPERPGEGYNLAKDWDGTPRKAFYVLRDNARADVNHDGFVDVYDVYMIARAWESRLGEAAYKPEADINEDAIIDDTDLMMLNTEYGKGF